MGIDQVIVHCHCGRANTLWVEYDLPEPETPTMPGSDLEVFIDDEVKCTGCGTILHAESVQEQAEKYITDLIGERQAGV